MRCIYPEVFSKKINFSLWWSKRKASGSLIQIVEKVDGREIRKLLLIAYTVNDRRGE